MSVIRGHFNFHSGGHLFSPPENCFHMSQKDFLFLHEKSVFFFKFYQHFFLRTVFLFASFRSGYFVYKIWQQNEKKYLEK